MLATIARIAQIGFLVTVTGVLGWFLWDKLPSSKPRRELDPYRDALARQAIEDVVAKLPRRDEIRKLVVIPVVKDVDGRVTDMLLDALDEADLYFLAADSAVADHLTEVRKGKPVLSELEAVSVGKALQEADSAITGVLFTALPRFEATRKGVGSTVTVECSLLSLERGQLVTEGFQKATVSIDSKASLGFFTPFMQSQSKVGRLALFLLFVGGLPFAMLPVGRAVLRLRDTTKNMVLCAAYTVVNVFVALVLMGFSPGWFGAALLLVTLLGGGLYNIVMLEKIEESL